MARRRKLQESVQPKGKGETGNDTQMPDGRLPSTSKPKAGPVPTFVAFQPPAPTSDIPAELMERKSALEALYSAVKCAICLRSYRNPTTLDCGHTYCKVCIDRMFTLQNRSDRQLIKGDPSRVSVECGQCRTVVKSRRSLRSDHEAATLAADVRRLIHKYNRDLRRAVDPSVLEFLQMESSQEDNSKQHWTTPAPKRRSFGAKAIQTIEETQEVELEKENSRAAPAPHSLNFEDQSIPSCSTAAPCPPANEQSDRQRDLVLHADQSSPQSRLLATARSANANIDHIPAYRVDTSPLQSQRTRSLAAEAAAMARAEDSSPDLCDPYDFIPSQKTETAAPKAENTRKRKKTTNKVPKAPPAKRSRHSANSNGDGMQSAIANFIGAKVASIRRRQAGVTGEVLEVEKEEEEPVEPNKFVQNEDIDIEETQDEPTEKNSEKKAKTTKDKSLETAERVVRRGNTGREKKSRNETAWSESQLQACERIEKEIAETDDYELEIVNLKKERRRERKAAQKHVDSTSDLDAPSSAMVADGRIEQQVVSVSDIGATGVPPQPARRLPTTSVTASKRPTQVAAPKPPVASSAASPEATVVSLHPPDAAPRPSTAVSVPKPPTPPVAAEQPSPVHPPRLLSSAIPESSNIPPGRNSLSPPETAPVHATVDGVIAGLTIAQLADLVKRAAPLLQVQVLPLSAVVNAPAKPAMETAGTQTSIVSCNTAAQTDNVQTRDASAGAVPMVSSRATGMGVQHGTVAVQTEPLTVEHIQSSVSSTDRALMGIIDCISPTPPTTDRARRSRPSAEPKQRAAQPNVPSTLDLLDMLEADEKKSTAAASRPVVVGGTNVTRTREMVTDADADLLDLLDSGKESPAGSRGNAGGSRGSVAEEMSRKNPYQPAQQPRSSGRLTSTPQRRERSTVASSHKKPSSKTRDLRDFTRKLVECPSREMSGTVVGGRTLVSSKPVNTTAGSAAKPSVAKPKKRMLLCGSNLGVRSDMQAALEHHAKRQHPRGAVAQTLSANVTQLVIPELENCRPQQRVCHPTLKYYQAIAMGIPIVSFEWIVDADRSGEPELDWRPYEIVGALMPERQPALTQQTQGQLSDPVTYASRRSREAREAGASDLFKGYVIYFEGEEESSLTKENFESLAKDLGATWCEFLEEFNDISRTKNDELRRLAILIGDSGNSETNTLRTCYVDRFACYPVSAQWFINSVAAYEVQPVESYLLVPDSMSR